MIRALWTAATGMKAQQQYVDVIANNLANVNTTGFKKSKVDFQDLLYQVLRASGTSVVEGSQIPTGIEVGHGVRQVATSKIFTQGDIAQTGNSLDVTIEGDGFFQILQPDGTIAYSRDGAFKMDSQGRMVTSDGFALEPAITIPAETTDVNIGTDGTISVITAGSSAPTTVGQITLAKFVNPAGLKSLGRNLYDSTTASGEPTIGTPGLSGLGTLSQGFLEMSNVKVIEEMVNMIIAQRAYEVNAKAIQAGDDMLSIANNIRR